MQKIAIVLLNNKGIETAKLIQEQVKEETIIWGLEGRVEGADKSFKETGTQLRELFECGTAIIGLCASGILIRSLAPILNNKRKEPPLLVVSDDGALVVPLLGGLTGANELAKEISRVTSGIPAITASGARHFAVQLEAPPKDYVLANPEEAKRVTSDILNDTSLQLDGHASWLEDSGLPFTLNGEITIRVSVFDEKPPSNGLLYHPKSVLVEVENEETSLDDIDKAFKDLGLAKQAIAAVITNENGPIGQAKKLGSSLKVPVRIVDNYTDLEIARRAKVPLSKQSEANSLSLIELNSPPDINYIGRAIGKVTVIGLGPGKESWLTPEVKTALEQAEILVGYKTYVDMVPVRVGQQRLASDNRVELDRARDALDLANQGRNVVVVSSGDPGIFAMASAVLEAIDKNPVRWKNIDFQICPGLSAMQGAASLTGAPLGHDFAVISLSDIRKPFEVIEKRLIASAKSDLVIAIYNPASKTRREQVERMKEVLLQHKAPETNVLMAKNIGRDGEQTHFTTLGELDTDMIDMRTMLIIGSSKTKLIKGPGQSQLLYTPRDYE